MTSLGKAMCSNKRCILATVGGYHGVERATNRIARCSEGLEYERSQVRKAFQCTHTGLADAISTWSIPTFC